MAYDNKSEIWTVSGTNQRTKESSVLRISKKTIGGYEFEWAMLVCETIKPDGACDQLPADPKGLTFTNVEVDGQKIDWIAREKLQDCNEKVRVNQYGDVTMTWTYSKSQANFLDS